MARPTNAERAARAAAQADATMPKGDVETFLQPVEKIAPDTAAPEGMATVRVLHKGNGRIATGHFDRRANAFTYHGKGDHLIIDAAIARDQEEAGLVEIVNGG